MTFTHANDANSSSLLPKTPSWISAAPMQSSEEAAFVAGAALSHLHLVLSCEGVPKALLLDRLALQAAEACVIFSGRPERAKELRDVIHLLRPSDLPGPAGETYLMWQRGVAQPLSVKCLGRTLHNIDLAQIADWLDMGQGAPVARAAKILQTVLMAMPRGEVAALILADGALAQALGWDHLVPLLAYGLKRSDLRKRNEDLRLACYRAVTTSVFEAARMAGNLAGRAEYLNAVAPKLRAKGAKNAVEIFLTRDAVAPAALPLPDRAARRLCDRLVDLGAIHELTGRDTFRLYGM